MSKKRKAVGVSGKIHFQRVANFKMLINKLLIKMRSFRNNYNPSLCSNCNG